jgi:3-isopropylmalate/(R)-2-methylmalate dehydratase large subunit
MDTAGYSCIIRNSGGVIVNPSCGACSGIHMGVCGKDDVIVTTTVRNTDGRMGSDGAKIYLASPKAASRFAIAGRICM